VLDGNSVLEAGLSSAVRFGAFDDASVADTVFSLVSAAISAAFGVDGLGAAGLEPRGLAVLGLAVLGLAVLGLGELGLAVLGLGELGLAVLGLGVLGLAVLNFAAVLDRVAAGWSTAAAAVFDRTGFLRAPVFCGEAGLAVDDFDDTVRPVAPVAGFRAATAGFFTGWLTVFLPSSGVWASFTVQTYQSVVGGKSAYHE